MTVTNKDLYESIDKLRKELEKDIKELDEKVDRAYTKLVQFHPVRNLVYGLVAIILSGFVGGLIVMLGWN